MSEEEFEFGRGGQSAREEAAKAGVQFARAQYFNLDENERQVLRYLTDEPDWIHVQQHTGAPTKNKPSDWPADRKWPETMPAVCRYEKGFRGKYSDCYICDADLKNKWGRSCKPTVRVWALACLREEVVGTPELVADGVCDESQIGKRIGYTDAWRNVAVTNDKGEATGEEKRERALVIVNFAPNNYFNALTASAMVYDGTVCDRDWVVTKTGEGKDADYTNVPLDRTDKLHPGTESWKRYTDAIEEQGLSLVKLIAGRADDEYYARFFDPSKTPAPREGQKASGNGASRPEVPSTETSDLDADKLAAMKERVRAKTGVGVGAKEID